MMKLYHGSTVIIDNIDVSFSHIGKDFGYGFYLSDNFDQAFKMAQFKSEQSAGSSPYVTTFEWDERALADSESKCLRFDDYSIEWAEFVLKNRKNTSSQNCHDYDIVIGPIANDKVGAQIRRYEFGDITVEQLVSRLKYQKGLTIKYFFATPKAIQQLKKYD